MTKDQLIDRLEKRHSADKAEIGQLIKVANHWKEAYTQAEKIILSVYKFACTVKRRNERKR